LPHVRTVTNQLNMAYTIEIANIVARTVGKFASLNSFQLSGHSANLDFWQQEIKHALDLLDGYDARQRVRTLAQKDYIHKHETRQHGFSVTPERSVVSKDALTTARRELTDAFYHFVRRCYSERLLTTEESKLALDSCGIGTEPGDFDD
jgi:hypothetical protein